MLLQNPCAEGYQSEERRRVEKASAGNCLVCQHCRRCFFFPGESQECASRGEKPGPRAVLPGSPFCAPVCLFHPPAVQIQLLGSRLLASQLQWLTISHLSPTGACAIPSAL